MTLSACMKEAPEKGVIRKDWLIGSWYEYYDPSVFAFDGSSVVTFSDDGSALWRYYDLLSNSSSSYDYRYFFNNNILSLIRENEEGDAYEVIFLNKNEMAWQRVGTTYSPGSWASDYKHFKRSTD